MHTARVSSVPASHGSGGISVPETAGGPTPAMPQACHSSRCPPRRPFPQGRRAGWPAIAGGRPVWGPTLFLLR
eukprot:9372750-Lingulodinium_polyedra.AAC.1